MYKGIKKNQNYTWLICAAQNMKNIAIKSTPRPKKHKKTDELSTIYIIFKIIYKNIKDLSRKYIKANKPHNLIWGLSTI
ncbi:hypothetical protein D3C80_2005460 [compost metagenome]